MRRCTFSLSALVVMVTVVTGLVAVDMQQETKKERDRLRPLSSIASSGPLQQSVKIADQLQLAGMRARSGRERRLRLHTRRRAARMLKPSDNSPRATSEAPQEGNPKSRGDRGTQAFIQSLIGKAVEGSASATGGRADLVDVRDEAEQRKVVKPVKVRQAVPRGGRSTTPDSAAARADGPVDDQELKETDSPGADSAEVASMTAESAAEKEEAQRSLELMKALDAHSAAAAAKAAAAGTERKIPVADALSRAGAEPAEPSGFRDTGSSQKRYRPLQPPAEEQLRTRGKLHYEAEEKSGQGSGQVQEAGQPSAGSREGGDGSEEPGSRQVALDGAAALAQSNSARPRAGDGIEEALRRAIDTLQSSEVEDGIWVLSAEEEEAEEERVTNDEDADDVSGMRKDPPTSRHAPDQAAGQEPEQEPQPDQDAGSESSNRDGEPEWPDQDTYEEELDQDGWEEELDQDGWEEEPDQDGWEEEPDQDGQQEEEELAEAGSGAAPESLSSILDHYGVESFLDVPCGDVREVVQKVRFFPTRNADNIRYWGVDSSERAVDSAGRELGDINLWSFHVMDYLHDDLPRADLLVSRAALLRPSLPKLVSMLENFARSGADRLLLGSFEAPSEAGSLRPAPGSGGVPFPVDLRREPFGLSEPLRAFTEPEGFSGEGTKIGDGTRIGDGARVGDGAKFGDGARRGNSAKPSKSGTAGTSAVERQLLLYSGEYLRAQDFAAMRARATAFLSPGPRDD